MFSSTNDVINASQLVLIVEIRNSGAKLICKCPRRMEESTMKCNYPGEYIKILLRTIRISLRDVELIYYMREPPTPLVP